MPQGVSYAGYLKSLSLEDGLIAEIQFRKFHLESLREWPDDERIRLFKYEAILGNEAEVFRQIFDFFLLSHAEQIAAAWLASRFSVDRRTDDRHIRDPRPGQWKERFTPRVAAYFDDRYADIIDRLEYRE